MVNHELLGHALENVDKWLKNIHEEINELSKELLIECFQLVLALD